jgi:TonB family protein
MALWLFHRTRLVRVFYSLPVAALLLVAMTTLLRAQDGGSPALSIGVRPEDFDRPQQPVDVPPALKEELDPQYPDAEKSRGHVGIVIVRAAIDARGDVTFAVVTKRCRYPVLDSSALRAVAGAWFKPALRDGKPVAAQLTIPVQFTTGTVDQLHDVQKTPEELREDVKRLETTKQAVENEQKAIEEEIRALKEARKKKGALPSGK